MAHMHSETSDVVERTTPDIGGFCKGYELRRHQSEHKANEGSLRCRADWERFIGPVERWGSCNPWEGHFGAVVVPFCKPERLAILCYIFEYAFLYDNVVESAAKSTLNMNTDNIALDETEYRTVRSILGTKQIQSKMLLELLSIDPPTAEVVIDSWKTMISTTAKRDKKRVFDNLEEYVDYRIVDTGAPFVDMLMRFGMGIFLTEDENKTIEPIVKPCWAALGLANDYFSFDIEWEEFQREADKKTMTNAVWLFMQWENLSVEQAKRRVREVTNAYEQEYLKRIAEYEQGEGKDCPKVVEYLRAEQYQIPGNVAWSLRCPRYHPWLCEEAAQLLKGDQADRNASPEAGRSRSQSESESSTFWSGSPRSSVSSTSDMHEKQSSTEVTLGEEHLRGPAEYIGSLPSKGVREAFIDGLNVWLLVPDDRVNQLKDIAKTLHNASLMLDDIEDSSPLRRGRPSTHMIFGQEQTINSANFLLVDVMDKVRKLDDPECMDIYIDEMRNLFIGQSFDLYWTKQGECPSEEEYLDMIRQKTGGLFRLLTRLMVQVSPIQRGLDTQLSSLSDILGQYFQIRDDYKNLSSDFTDQKGFCEDLDECKFSYPLIHALTSQPKNVQLRGILRQSRTSGGLDVPLKENVLGQLRQAGSLAYTEEKLGDLMEKITDAVLSLETDTGSPNWVVRLLIHRLRV